MMYLLQVIHMTMTTRITILTLTMTAALAPMAHIFHLSL